MMDGDARSSRDRGSTLTVRHTPLRLVVCPHAEHRTTTLTCSDRKGEPTPTNPCYSDLPPGVLAWEALHRPQSSALESRVQRTSMLCSTTMTASSCSSPH
jgi:hypothetical protein